MCSSHYSFYSSFYSSFSSLFFTLLFTFTIHSSCHILLYTLPLCALVINSSFLHFSLHFSRTEKFFFWKHIFFYFCDATPILFFVHRFFFYALYFFLKSSLFISSLFFTFLFTFLHFSSLFSSFYSHHSSFYSRNIGGIKRHRAHHYLRDFGVRKSHPKIVNSSASGSTSWTSSRFHLFFTWSLSLNYYSVVRACHRL